MQTVRVLLILAVSLRSGLRHQPGLKPHFRLAHLALDLGLGRQRGYGVDHDDIDRARTDQMVGDLERLLAVIGLRNKQLIDVHAQFPGIRAVERMLGIDKGSDAARFLRLGDRMNRERRLARRLGTEYLDHPALGVASDAERLIDRNRSRRNNRNLVDLLAAHLHDRTLAEVLFDLVHYGAQHFELLRINLCFFCHSYSVLYLFSCVSVFRSKERPPASANAFLRSSFPFSAERSRQAPFSGSGQARRSRTFSFISLDDLLEMVLGPNLIEHPLDHALLVDDERRAQNTHERTPHELLFAPNAVGFRNDLVGIGKQREVQPLLFDKSPMRFLAVGDLRPRLRSPSRATRRGRRADCMPRPYSPAYCLSDKNKESAYGRRNRPASFCFRPDPSPRTQAPDSPL